MSAPQDKKWIWPFELEEQLGAGGMGVVYRARYVGNNRRVAVKILPDHVAANPVLAARFAREMELLKDLKHPHIVNCFGGTTEGKQWFYAMELVEGGNVESLLKENGRLSWERVIEFAKQTAQALSCAHASNIIHRDLKPANLLLTKGGRIKLADFGLALVADEDRLTAAGKTMGTFHYMSPEQIRGKPPLSNRTDLYALGCVIYEMLCGEPPFTGSNAGEILHRHVHDEPPRITAKVRDCPPQLETLILDLLRKDPAERPADADEVERRLGEIEPIVVVDRRASARQLAETSSAPVASTPSKSSRNPVVRDTVPAAIDWWLIGGAGTLLALVVWSLAAATGHGPYAQSEQLWVRALEPGRPKDVRVTAAQALGELGPLAARALPAVARGLDDADLAVRAASVIAVGRMGVVARSERTKLVRLQREDPEPDVRHAAGEAITQIDKATNPSPWPVRLAWLGALGVVGWRVWSGRK
jgi:eukaryotic-like serine/threonine-protein kinase